MLLVGRMNRRLLVLISVVAAVATEALAQKIMRKKITITDGSAVVTGMLLAMVLSPAVPLWMPVVGAFCSIVIAKSIFGGLGNNIFNPALLSRAGWRVQWWAAHVGTFAMGPRPHCRVLRARMTAVGDSTRIEETSYYSSQIVLALVDRQIDLGNRREGYRVDCE